MFNSRIGKSLSVILSSCTLGLLSSCLTCQLSAKGVSVNKGTEVEPGSFSSDSSNLSNLSNLEQFNDGDMAVTFGQDPLTSFDGYILKGNVINYGEKRHLVTYDSVPPLNCDLYVRAIKIKDGFSKDVAYDPDTSDTSLDSGWIKYEGRATFDHLASTTGLWHTYAVRYNGEDFKNDYDVKYVVLDKSRSTDGINRYTLLDVDRNVVIPDVNESSESNELSGSSESSVPSGSSESNAPLESSELNESSESSEVNAPFESSEVNAPSESSEVNEPSESSEVNEPSESSDYNDLSESYEFSEYSESSDYNEP
jgi:hypothetical protein